MKKYLLIVVALAISFYSFSQENADVFDENTDEIKTLFGDKAVHGGYGGFSVRYTEINNQEGLVIGGRGAWIMNHAFSIGAAGYGFFNEASPAPINLGMDEDYRIGGGYGGLLIEPIIAGKFPVHISLPVLIGAGGLVYTKDYRDTWNSMNNEEWEPYHEDADAFFIIEPGVELEFNLLKFVRVSFGAYHRFTSEIILESDMEVSDPSISTELAPRDVLNNFTFGFALKFGKF